MNKLSLWRTICFVCMFCVVDVIGSPAQTFKSLVRFNGTDGAGPNGPLVQGRDGDFYGTTFSGGNTSASCYAGGGCGTVFKITAAGELTTLYSFCIQTGCPNASNPVAGLVLATDGNFYGTTIYSPPNAGGTVFKITPSGKLTILHTFCQGDCTDGFGPRGGLVQGTDGNFYGTASDGGVGPYCHIRNGCGTIFKITPAGKLTPLYKFCSQTNCIDGRNPQAGLVQGTDGNFYGTAVYGGSSPACGRQGCGTVFKITPAGKLTTLHSFHNTDGRYATAGLMQGTDGNFYGTTTGGGANRAGTVYKITPASKLTTLYSFCPQTNCVDGQAPQAGLVQGTDGNFYGATSEGGVNDNYGTSGTVFKMTPAGALTTLYSFCSHANCPDGAVPGALTQATNGDLYGTAAEGGNGDCFAGCGTVFSLAVGLGPFVVTNPNSGKVGAKVVILANNLRGTTGVAFNGTAATFTVVSNTEIKTTVPSCATTGFVTVTTPNKKLKSNVVFRVTQ
jgi:uncharacterized repeat protein (TIGR03803 family)